VAAATVPPLAEEATDRRRHASICPNDRPALPDDDKFSPKFLGGTSLMRLIALNKVGTATNPLAVCPAPAHTMLDRLIPFSEGYMMVAWGKKAA
jgi:hypothetical protein